MKNLFGNPKESSHSVIIVGGSLAGLMTGIALAQENMNVTIVEKVSEHRQGGSGLRVNGGTFGRSKTETLLKRLVSNGEDSVQLWSTIESRLREVAKKDQRITLRYNTRVESVGQDQEQAWVVTDKEETLKADFVIGADGHRSHVRKAVAPDQPDATYAGYMGWIASVGEEELPNTMQLASTVDGPTVDMFDSWDGFKFGSIIETDDPEKSRRIGCTWYDNKQSEMLREVGCVEGMVVRHSLDGEDVPQPTLDQLASEAAKWPEPWRFAALYGIETRTLIGIPIKEYVPSRLVNGRLALVGDAAHVPAPVTASGFNESLQDAVVLGECVAKRHRQSFEEILKTYEKIRLERVRQMVQSGHFYSQSFGRP
ncbi:FAD-dependent monooxygenase [Sporosarcina sp. PTS2304]|uniref:FAD-dependent oxidoreductase n=1 Tax=Sporosarcina sp. PTS2304 TaxID=2283194 RepID=UPI000E0DF9A8|nr:NAD(P)/FAD-dependent oxidoreductase [Sporosarcina sp. PTS2304]AXI00190.1 FAD-dependent monooxygenase [Sporosarcina sp. PTS2304]